MSRLPYELQLAVFDELLSDRVENCPWYLEHWSVPHSGLRLWQFRTLASVCKAWLDPARSIFWKEIALPTCTLPRFVFELSRATAKPRCIRKLYVLAFAPSARLKVFNDFHPPEVNSMVQDLSTILHSLPSTLHIFHVSCPKVNPDGFVDETGQKLYSAVTKALDLYDGSFAVVTLSVNPRPDARNIYSVIDHFRNISNLRLSISCHDDASTFASLVLETPLRSLAIDVDFLDVMIDDDSPTGNYILAAEQLRVALKPSCLKLESHTLTFYSRTDRDPAIYLSVFRTLHEIGHTTVSTFVFRSMGERTAYGHTVEPPFFWAKVNVDVLSEFPLLRSLVLDESGISSQVIEYLNCTSLKNLTLVIQEQTEQAGWRTKADVVQILTMPQLSQLEVLRVAFGSVYQQTGPMWDEMSPSRIRIWAPVEKECIARNIKLILDYGDPDHVGELEEPDWFADRICSSQALLTYSCLI